MDKRRMCPHCRAFITVNDKVCPYCDTAVGPRAIERRSPDEVLGGFIPHARFLTMMILTINIGLYAATALYSMRHGNPDVMSIDGRTLVQFGAKYPPFIFDGQWWRLITAGFLHGGLFHIMMNSWVLFDLGAQVEETYGALRMMVIYFAATVFGFLASTLWSGSISIGASAGIFGLIGAMIALGAKHPFGEAMRGLYIRWAVYGLLIGFLPFFRMDNAAHLGGLAGGFAVAWLAGLPSLINNWKERFWRVAAWLSLFLTGLAFARMVLWFAAMQG